MQTGGFIFAERQEGGVIQEKKRKKKQHKCLLSL